MLTLSSLRLSAARLTRQASSLPKYNTACMPSLTPSMQSVGRLQWIRQPGEFVAEGEVLAEFATTKKVKVSSERPTIRRLSYKATQSGYVAKVLVGATDGCRSHPAPSPPCLLLSEADASAPRRVA